METDRLLSAAIEARVRASFAAQPTIATLGAEIVGLGHDRSQIAAPTVREDGMEVVTSELKINLLAPPVGDRVVAEGKVVKPCRRLVVVQTDVWAEADGDRRHSALLTGTMVPVPA